MGRLARPVGWLVLIAVGLVGAARDPVRAPPASYRPACYVFSETVRTTIQSRSGSATVRDRAGRDGVLVVSLVGRADSLGLAAWYDSLGVWRESSTGTERPGTDGFLGGRYRGVLTSDGRYSAEALPFVPEDLAQLADLEGVMDDFLPRLPPGGIATGGDWKDSTLAIHRDSDLRDRLGPAERYRWTATRRQTDKIGGDERAVTLNQQVKEEGELRWSPEQGPLGWTRHLTISARVPSSDQVKRSMQSSIEQDITVVRRLGDALCRNLKGGR